MYKPMYNARVYHGKQADAVEPFKLPNFKDKEDELRQKVSRSEEFKPDFQGVREREFVLGGFDFDYHGGYKRDEILKKTSDEVEGMIRKAEGRVAEIEKEAEERGYREGFDKGKAEGFREVNELMEAFQKGLAQLQESRDEFYKKAEKEMVDIITLVASEIIRREVQSDHNIIKDVIRNTVEEITSRQEITIRINPVDMDAAKELADSLVDQMEQVKGVQLQSDSTISEGGCIIETNVGRLDATVENRLLEIYRNLKQKAI